jgi:hypothetical protein
VCAKLINLSGNKALIGVGCPAHILNNCVHHAAENLDVDIECIIFKIFQYFHIYTVRTEQLKEYCDFVEIEYKKFPSHSKTRWLSLRASISRIIHMFPALKSFFLSQAKPPEMVKTFFENEMSEMYSWNMQFIMCVFQSHILETEKENNSVVEVLRVLISIRDIFVERQGQNFTSLKVKTLIEEKHREGLRADCDKFCAEVNCLYESCIEYLKKWMQPMEEFSCFMWMALNDIPQCSNVKLSLKFLRV